MLHSLSKKKLIEKGKKQSASFLKREIQARHVGMTLHNLQAGKYLSNTKSQIMPNLIRILEPQYRIS